MTFRAKEDDRAGGVSVFTECSVVGYVINKKKSPMKLTFTGDMGRVVSK